MAYKVFTNGSVLQASEINDNLMRQSVMVFSNAAARSAALTVPLAGMLTYLQDTGLYSTYNGSAWVPLDVSLITSVNFTTSSSVNIDGCFTSNYANYSVIASFRSSATTSMRMTMRAGGVNETGNVNIYGEYYVGNFTSLAAGSTNNTTSTVLGFGEGNLTSGISGAVTFYNPNAILRTQVQWNTTGAAMVLGGGTVNTTTQYTGFRIFPSAGTITGDIRVYGLRN